MVTIGSSPIVTLKFDGIEMGVANMKPSYWGPLTIYYRSNLTPGETFFRDGKKYRVVQNSKDNGIHLFAYRKM